MTASPQPAGAHRRLSRRAVLAGAGASLGAAGLAALIAHGPGSAQELVQGPATPNVLGSPVPPEVTQYAGDWPLPTGNLAATRVALNSPITAANVSKLKVAWTMPIKAASLFGGFSSNPLVVGPTVYVQDLASNVFALDRASGNVRWQKTYNIGCTGPNGPAVGYGMVYAALGDTAEVVALAADSGAEVWRVRLAVATDDGIDMAPMVHNNTVYISTIPGTSKQGNFYRGGARGILYALDAKTGNTLWSFDTATDNLWGNARLNSGAGLWFPPSIDAQGNLFFGTGNPAPWPGAVVDGTPYPNGASRPGPNLYSSCMVSLDARTGAVRWYVQAKPHDLFDHDFQQTPALTTVTLNGAQTPLAIGAGKTGTVIAAEANSGKVLWQVPVGKHENDLIDAIPPGQTITAYPGDLGGVETPLAVADGTVFVPYIDYSGSYTATGLGSATADLATGTGGLVALDAATGAVKWEVKLPTMNTGGATVANDVVFTATLDGLFRAYHTTDGKELWTSQASAGINAWPAIAGDTVVIGAAAPLIKPAAAAAPATPGGPAGVQPTATPQAPAFQLLTFKLGS